MGIRQTLDNLEPHFHKGGKYEQFYPLYEAVDTIFYTPRAWPRQPPMCATASISSAS
ncbi:Na(+)-translocating NADH-quinone reductase subunit B [Halomonas elongata]|uniref:Na(+)-translocating NADH-quinone reductase subunit B n=1 Tax=Halomonas elongata TaxID=2746 RepID=A0A1B8P3Q3_HALEL|nr:Na(+)-translocating NADH-quinone reductase subunit B [Halomonas elongata]